MQFNILLLLAMLIPHFAEAADFCVPYRHRWISNFPVSIQHLTLGKISCDAIGDGSKIQCNNQYGESIHGRFINKGEFSAIALTGNQREHYCYFKTDCTFGPIPDDVKPEQLEIVRRFALKDLCRIRE